VTDIQLGRILRAVRRRRGRPQREVASTVGVSQSTLSRIERGHLDQVSLRTLRAVFAALEIRLELVATWRGAELERLLDEDHAVLVGSVALILERRRWDVAVEVTYSRFGERGSIDILAIHRATSAVLVVEVKTRLGSVEATLRRLDEKARLGALIAAERFGRRPGHVSRLIVLPDRSTERRTAARHSGVFSRSVPVQDGRLIRAWLRAPAAPLAGLWFLSASHSRTQRQTGRRLVAPGRLCQSPGD
jgi:transcriptional regulator with XRE-family HTH domain